MKVLHTSDWHLGQKFYEHSRQDEHQAFLEWLCSTISEYQVDVLLVSGDIYHSSNPPTHAEQQLYAFIKKVKSYSPSLHIVLIAGNHDSASRVEAAQPLLNAFDTFVVGRFDIDNPSHCVKLIEVSGEHLGVVAMPFLRPAELCINPNEDEAYTKAFKSAYRAAVETLPQNQIPLILMGHCHVKGGSVSEDSERNVTIGGFDAIPAHVFELNEQEKTPTYVALGHLHKAQKVGGNESIRYSGTPMPMSFSEKNYRHQALLVTFEQGSMTEVRPLFIPRRNELVTLPPHGGADLVTLCQTIKEHNWVQYSYPPYVRLKLLSTELDSQFREKVEEALKGLDIQFCGIERVSTARESSDEAVLEDLSSVADLCPANLLDFAFQSHFDTEDKASDAVHACLQQVLAEVEVKV